MAHTTQTRALMAKSDCEGIQVPEHALPDSSIGSPSHFIAATTDKSLAFSEKLIPLFCRAKRKGGGKVISEKFRLFSEIYFSKIIKQIGSLGWVGCNGTQKEAQT